MELTVPFEMNIIKAHTRKMERYGSLVTDLKHIAGYNVQLLCVEIGSRGLITQDNKSRIKSIFKYAGSKARQSLFKDISTNALLCSYALWNCRHEPLWVECPYIKVSQGFTCLVVLPLIPIGVTVTPLCIGAFFIHNACCNICFTVFNVFKCIIDK